MSQINPYYEFKVLQLLPRACAIPLTEAEKVGKSKEELFTDGIQIMLTDAVGKKHRMVIHRAAFPISGGNPDETVIKRGTTGFINIEATGNLCVNLSDFEPKKRSNQSNQKHP